MRIKKYSKALGVLTLLILLASCFAGCNFILGKLGLGGTFSLENASVALKIGEVYEVTLSANSKKEGFKLSSSDESKVQVVDDIKLKGIAKTLSTVSVTATSDSGGTATVSVTVDYAELGSLAMISSGGDKIQLLEDDEAISPILFTAVTDEGIDPNTLVSWRVTEKGKETNVETHTGNASDNTFTFTPVNRKVMYEVSVAVGGMSAKTECGVFNKLFVSSEKDRYKVGSSITLDMMIKPDADVVGNKVVIDVYFNDVLKFNDMSVDFSGEAILKNAKIPLGVFNDIGTYDITVDYNGTLSNVVTVIVADYVATDHIDVSAESALLQQKSTAKTVSFSATVSPSGANPDAVEWYVNGILKGAGGDFSYRPTSGAYGEYHVVAVADKLYSKTLTIVYLPTTDSRWNYADDITAYGGSVQNRYITSQQEMNAVIVYALEYQKYGSSANTLDLYVDYPYTGGISDAVDVARLSYPESGLIAGYTKTEETDGKQIHLAFSYYVDGTKIINSPSVDAGTDSTPQSTDSKPHYTAGNYTRNFYIDSQTKTMTVSTSNMLYKAVSWGYKPVFENNANGILLKQIYLNARATLSKICTDGMSEYEKVHAIYDWIIYNVRYDYDLAADNSNGNKLVLNANMGYYGYYLEGIFLDAFYNNGLSHAVCDGKSKAFVLMCGIEGITSLRIVGSVAAGGHAWNKVLVDPDDDGNKNWFVIDTTWGDNALTVNGLGTTEYLTHGYFMINDAVIASTHDEDERGYPVADGNYDYYSKTTFTYGASTYNMNIQNGLGGISPSTKLKYLFSWAKKKGLKYVEFEYEGTLTQSMVTTAANLAEVNLKYDTPLGVRTGVYGVAFR